MNSTMGVNSLPETVDRQQKRSKRDRRRGQAEEAVRIDELSRRSRCHGGDFPKTAEDISV